MANLKFNWSKFGTIMLNVAKVAPFAVLMAQGLATENDEGATKMQMAQESLKLLTGLDQVVATNEVDAQHIAAINDIATQQMQSWVDTFKQHGVGSFKPAVVLTSIPAVAVAATAGK